MSQHARSVVRTWEANPKPKHLPANRQKMELDASSRCLISHFVYFPLYGFFVAFCFVCFSFPPSVRFGSGFGLGACEC